MKYLKQNKTDRVFGSKCMQFKEIYIGTQRSTIDTSEQESQTWHDVWQQIEFVICFTLANDSF